MTRDEIQAEVRRIVDFTIADARLHENLEDLSNESVTAIMALISPSNRHTPQG